MQSAYFRSEGRWVFRRFGMRTRYPLPRPLRRLRVRVALARIRRLAGRRAFGSGFVRRGRVGSRNLGSENRLEIALGRFLGRGFLGPLGLLHRRELLLGWQLAALGDDGRAHDDVHVLEELDRHLVATDPLDRVDADSAAVD